MTITDEEVEAAAKAMHDTAWEKVYTMEGYRMWARLALEAAAARVRAGNVQKTEG